MIDKKNNDVNAAENQDAQHTNLSNSDTSSEQKLEVENKASGPVEESKEDDQEGWVRLESGLGINE